MIARIVLSLALALTVMQSGAQTSSAATEATASSPRLLTATEATAILPATVFFRGQSAAIQARNSGGVEFGKGRYLLATLVDTSGYSSSVQERYQSYLITEVPIVIEGHRLAPGAYGCGFIAGDHFVVMDLGGNDLFLAASHKDAALKRPTPLQLIATPGVTPTYRLIAGRAYVDLKAAMGSQP